MAQKNGNDKPIEVSLWEAANKLRGSVEPAEYKHVVLGLIFLKFAGDKFEDHRAKTFYCFQTHQRYCPRYSSNERQSSGNDKRCFAK